MEALLVLAESCKTTEDAGVVGGRESGSSDKRVSLHQKLLSTR